LGTYSLFLPQLPTNLNAQSLTQPSFVGIFIVVTIAYGTSWMVLNKREEKIEAARKANMIERGYGPSDEEACMDKKDKAARRNEGRAEGTNME
jgi:hypothetical protein